VKYRFDSQKASNVFSRLVERLGPQVAMPAPASDPNVRRAEAVGEVAEKREPEIQEHRLSEIDGLVCVHGSRDCPRI
jgi:hypothetical protein